MSQSSNLSLYCRIFFFIELLSTQPTWSYSWRVTRKAGAVTTSVPTRTCPCSMKVTDSFMVSANFKLHSSTASLLLQNAETDNFSATSTFSLELMTPILYSFSRSCSVALMRKGSSKGSCLILQMSPVTNPHILLQWVQSWRSWRWQRCITLDSRLSDSAFQSQKFTFFSSFCSWNLSLRIVDDYNIVHRLNKHSSLGWTLLSNHIEQKERNFSLNDDQRLAILSFQLDEMNSPQLS